ncbi:MAG: ATP-dependent zinc metalloprotease FtsH [bacterium]
MNSKNLMKNFFVVLVIFLAIAAIFSYVQKGNQKPTTIGLQQLVNEINEGQVATIKVEQEKLLVTLKDSTSQLATKEAGQSLSSLLNDLGVAPEKIAQVDIEVKSVSGTALWFTVILPILLPVLLIVVFIFFMLRGVQGANSKAMMFGQSQAKEVTNDPNNKTTFADVAGAKEAKEELEEVVEFLREPKKFTSLGARIPRGVLLLGSPGTGKTLLAKAVAGEAKVPFYSISGSEFVEMFVGVGASRVRDLFKKAKKSAPCIVFIDEIDAVGRRRGAGLGGSHDEREQTLNQILVEMDGFDPHSGVIVIAATNRPDVLDPALLRPGRFDRQVIIDLPDIKDREAILQIHAKNKPLAKDVKLRLVAERTPGFSGADLSNVLNEAAILTGRQGQKEITLEYLYSAIEKVMLGPERRSRVISKKEREITAYHEAGHAVVAHFLPHTDPVHKISIIARGQAGGYTLKLPTEDRHMHTKQEFLEEIAVLLGGYLSEEEIFGQVTTGATSDLRHATQIAKKLITDYGMSANLGLRTFGEKEEMIFLGREIHGQRDYSEKVAEQIDQEVLSFINQGKALAQEILRHRKDELAKVVKELLEKETIERYEFEKLVGKKQLAEGEVEVGAELK